MRYEQSTVPSSTLHPTILWAQRSDKLLLTIEVWEVCDEAFTFTPTSMSFQGKNAETKQCYAVEIEFFGSIVPDNVEKHVGQRAITLVVPKENVEAPFWPRLTKSSSKFHFIKTDFSKWVDEDEINETYGGMEGGFDPSNFDLASMMGGGGMMGGNMMGGDFEGHHDLEDSDDDNEEISDNAEANDLESGGHSHGPGCSHHNH